MTVDSVTPVERLRFGGGSIMLCAALVAVLAAASLVHLGSLPLQGPLAATLDKIERFEISLGVTIAPSTLQYALLAFVVFVMSTARTHFRLLPQLGEREGGLIWESFRFFGGIVAAFFLLPVSIFMLLLVIAVGPFGFDGIFLLIMLGTSMMRSFGYAFGINLLAAAAATCSLVAVLWMSAAA